MPPPGHRGKENRSQPPRGGWGPERTLAVRPLDLRAEAGLGEDGGQGDKRCSLQTTGRTLAGMGGIWGADGWKVKVFSFYSFSHPIEELSSMPDGRFCFVL